MKKMNMEMNGNEVVGNIIMEALHADVPDPMQRLDRHLVGKIAVAHNRLRSPHRFHGFQYGKSLRAILGRRCFMDITTDLPKIPVIRSLKAVF